jgi:hypothetical protein
MEGEMEGLRLSKESQERAAATKEYLETMMKERKAAMAERRQRRIALAQQLADPALTDADRKKVQEAFEARERELLRETRKRYSAADFEPLVIIGRGAFGEVKLVRAKEDGAIYALKVREPRAAAAAAVEKDWQGRIGQPSLKEPDGRAAMHGAAWTPSLDCRRSRWWFMRPLLAHFQLCTPAGPASPSVGHAQGGDDPEEPGGARARGAQRARGVGEPVGRGSPLLLPGRREPVPGACGLIDGRGRKRGAR